MAMSDNENKTNLIINYLPQTYTDEEMYTLFSTIGEVVNCKIIRDKTTGYSYGFGFVEFANPGDAMNAISSLNGCEIGNKQLKVALARPPGENTKGANLYVRNVPHNYNEHSLRDLFAQYGSIIQCRILTDQITKASKGVAFVLFDNRECAEIALKEMNGQTPHGGAAPLAIKFADDNAKKVRAPAAGRGYGGMQQFSGGPRPGGPMRGPGAGAGRMRYNPMSTGGSVGSSNGFGTYAGGYTGGYGGQPKARMSGGGGIGGAVSPSGARGTGFSQFGAGDASSQGGVILFVYNIGSDATDSDLWNLFCPYGTVKKVNVIWDHTANKCKGFGFVTMSTMDEAKYAIEYLNGFYYRTSPLQVSIKTDKN